MPYTIRLTCPRENESIIQSWCETHFSKYLLAFEVSHRDKDHFHLYVDSSLTNYQINKLITQELPFIPPGNGGRSVAKVKKEFESKCYTVKDGQYTSKGFAPKELKTIVDSSYQKTDFKTAYTKLEQDIIDYDGPINKMMVENWFRALIDLQIRCQRKIYNKFQLENWMFQCVMRNHTNGYRDRYIAHAVHTTMQMFDLPYDDPVEKYYRQEAELEAIGEIVKSGETEGAFFFDEKFLEYIVPEDGVPKNL